MNFTVYIGDTNKALKLIEKESVDAVMTSPPFWGLRDYGVKGQIGLEPTPQKYIQNIVKVSEEIKRVLKLSGSYWLNLGDTYNSHRDWSYSDWESKKIATKGNQKQPINSEWLVPKQKLLMPHRTAIALQDTGWICRNDVVWHKPSHMPSSVKDRLTNSFEFVFHFVKQKKYYYDLDAIREPHSTTIKEMGADKNGNYNGQATKNYSLAKAQNPSETKKRILENLNPSGKNPSDFWQINPKPFPEAHFACFPPALIRKPIKATVPKQVCTKCGKARERIIETSGYRTAEEEKELQRLVKETGVPRHSLGLKVPSHSQKDFKGFSSCSCNAKFKAGTVLDPFLGSGTTLQEAMQQGKNGIGIELNPDYSPIIMRRLNCRAKLKKNTFTNGQGDTLKFITLDGSEIKYKKKPPKPIQKGQATLTQQEEKQ